MVARITALERYATEGGAGMSGGAEAPMTESGGGGGGGGEATGLGGGAGFGGGGGVGSPPGGGGGGGPAVGVVRIVQLPQSQSLTLRNHLLLQLFLLNPHHLLILQGVVVEEVELVLTVEVVVLVVEVACQGQVSQSSFSNFHYIFKT